MFAAAIGILASPFALFAIGRVLFLALAAFLAMLGIPAVDIGEELLVLLVLFVMIAVAVLVAVTIARIKGWL